MVVAQSLFVVLGIVLHSSTQDCALGSGGCPVTLCCAWDCAAFPRCCLVCVHARAEHDEPSNLQKPSAQRWGGEKHAVAKSTPFLVFINCAAFLKHAVAKCTPFRKLP